MSKLRVGVIGCGGIANNHIRGYLEDVVSICTICSATTSATG